MTNSRRAIALLVVGAGVVVAAGTWAQEPPAPPPPAAAGDLFAQPGRCEDCHDDSGWERLRAPPPDRFDHATTGFPLRGAHSHVSCDGCHQRGLEALTSSCGGCHHDPHTGLNGTSCERCHTDRSWAVPRDITIHETTRFPLTGAHATIQCEACHRPRRAEPAATIPMDCVVCHGRNLRLARPDHVAAGFTECGFCHSTTTFRGATFRHRSFPNSGAHAFLRCTECHPGTAFVGIASGGSDCFACHADDYQRTSSIGGTVPDHVASGFPTTCRDCHNTNAFSPATP